MQARNHAATGSLPAIAAVPFRDRFKEIKQPKCQEKVAFYAGCLIASIAGLTLGLVTLTAGTPIEAVVLPIGLPGTGAQERWQSVVTGLSAFAAGLLAVAVSAPRLRRAALLAVPALLDRKSVV